MTKLVQWFLGYSYQKLQTVPGPEWVCKYYYAFGYLRGRGGYACRNINYYYYFKKCQSPL